MVNFNPLKFYRHLTKEFRKLYANHGPDHNYDTHLKYVVQNAQSICLANNIKYTKEMELGAVLHDCTEIYDRKNHHKSAARAVPYILEDLGITDVDVELVQKCVRYHRASETADITNMPIDVRVVSAADRMKAYDTKENVLEFILYRAYLYSKTHDDEVDDTSDPAYSAWKYNREVFTLDSIKSRKIYSDLYRSVWGEQLKKQAEIIQSITLDEFRTWLREVKGENC